MEGEKNTDENVQEHKDNDTKQKYYKYLKHISLIHNLFHLHSSIHTPQ